MIRSIVKKYVLSRMVHIERFKKNALEDQEKLFHYLIDKGKHTSYGKKYGLSQVRNIVQFSRAMPDVNYSDYFPEVLRMLQGEKHVGWPGTPAYYAVSSGTSQGDRKYVPTYTQFIKNNHFLVGRDFICNYLSQHPESALLRGSSIFLGGSFHPTDYNVRCADVSALIVENIPYVVHRVLSGISKKILTMYDWQEKCQKICERALRGRITSIAGVPTWVLPVAKKMMEMSTKNTQTLWKDLEVYFHGGVYFDPYLPIFKKLFEKDTMRFYENYNASEGYFAFQDQPHSKEMLLATNHHVFYEFKPFPYTAGDKIRPLAEVETDKIYEMVITNSSGLWRYKIGDTVRFTSLNPYRIKIVGRVSGFLNAFGEGVVEEHAQTALKAACEQVPATVSSFMVGPEHLENEAGRHEWLIEFEEKPADFGKFCQVLDETLQVVCHDYRGKRKNNFGLKKPKVTSLPKHTFYRWMEKRKKVGGQHKVPHLQTKRDYLEEILQL